MDSERFKRSKSPLHIKSYNFAVRIVNMVKYIDCPSKMISLTNQVFRSGTAIAALIREAEFAQSSSDFINKLNVSLKECNETTFWLNLLKDNDFITEKEYDSMMEDCDELMALLISSIKTSKQRNNK